MLFLGGHPSEDFKDLPHDLPLHNGWRGCIWEVGGQAIGSGKAVGGRGVGQCGVAQCTSRSCNAPKGVCIHSPATYGCENIFSVHVHNNLRWITYVWYIRLFQVHLQRRVVRGYLLDNEEPMRSICYALQGTLCDYYRSKCSMRLPIWTVWHWLWWRYTFWEI